MTTLPDDQYGEFGATSSACAHVAGVAALTWAVNPDLTNEQLREILLNTAEDLGLGREYQGWGLVRADRAVSPPVMGYVLGSIPPIGAFPLQGARVEVHETEDYAFTDYYGYYEILLPPGSYTLTASYPTFKNKTYYDVQVVPGQLTQRTFTLEQMYPGLPIPLDIPRQASVEVGTLQTSQDGPDHLRALR
jgi:subtilisin family serine protease